MKQGFLQPRAHAERRARVQRLLDSWGYVVAGREITNDVAYVGSPPWYDGSEPDRVAAGRTPSGMLDAYLDVERLINESGSTVIRRIVYWRHVQGVEYRPSVAVVTLPDREVLELPYGEWLLQPPVQFDGVTYRYDRVEAPWSDCPLALELVPAGRLANGRDVVRWLYGRFVDVVGGGSWRRR